MRITKSLPIAVLLIVACHWNGTVKLAREPHANTQPIASAPETSSVVANIAPTASATFTDADFARHVALLKSYIK
jgi:hypothetical protein